MTLVVAIGGVRSGKSAWAERQADELAGGLPVTVLTTADPTDRSMLDRIVRHQARRPASWTVRELFGSDDLAGALPDHGVALLDGIGGWAASLLERAGAFADDRSAARAGTLRASADAHAALQALIDAAGSPTRALVVASEEAGLGVVPLGAGTSAWVDLVGELNQRLVQAADLAVMIVAGRALPLTDSAPTLSRGEAGPLSVVQGDGPSAGPAADGERRSHPRLLGAAPARPTLADPPVGADGGTGGQPTEGTELSAEEAAALRSHGDRLVRPGDADHAVNIAAQGPPSWLADAFAGVLLEGRLTRYPDAADAEQALATIVGRPAGEVVATNGAAQALWLLPAAMRPQLAACVHPVFTEAEAALRAHGVPVVRIHRDPAQDFALDPALVPEAADLVIVGNPAAASGTLAAAETILALRRPGRTIVVDEAFMDLVPGEHESLAADRADDLIVIRSFTKSLAIPGVRCGAALAAAPLAARLRSVLPPWSVNAFAIAGLVALAAHPEELPARAERAAAERADLAQRLADVPGVRAWPSSANHILIRVNGGARVAAALKDRQIAVRPCGSFPGLTDDDLRLTARGPEANAALVAALAQAVGAGAGSTA